MEGPSEKADSRELPDHAEKEPDTLENQSTPGTLVVHDTILVFAVEASYNRSQQFEKYVAKSRWYIANHSQ